MSEYNARLAVICGQAELANSISVAPQFSDGKYIEDEAKRAENIVLAANQHSFLESLEDKSKILIGTAWGSAVQTYADLHGEMPRAEIMAAAYSGLQNMLEGKASSDTDGSVKIMLESASADTSTSDGVIVRENLAALILPVMLQQATSACSTFIPAGRDRADIFRLHTVAKSNFGDYSAGDKLDPSAVGQYTQMRQRYNFPMQPDGTRTTFTLDPATDLKVGKAMAIKINRNRIFADGQLIGGDHTEGDSKIYGDLEGNAIDNTSSSANPSTGVVTVKFASAPADGVILSAQVEVNIEADPTLIPVTGQTMERKTLRPAQYAVAAESSVMAQWSMKREFSIATQSSNLTFMRNKLASEKDRAVLSDIRFHCRHNSQFDIKLPSGLKKVDHYHTLSGFMAKKSQEMMTRTTVTGILGAYIGPDSFEFCADLEGEGFVFAPNYDMKPYIHYVGKLFGQYDIYLDPFAAGEDADAFLCYGRGQNHSQAGYVVGDAVPPINYTHPTTAGLTDRNTLWGHGYREIHPYDGADFFERVRLIASA